MLKKYNIFKTRENRTKHILRKDKKLVNNSNKLNSIACICHVNKIYNI